VSRAVVVKEMTIQSTEGGQESSDFNDDVGLEEIWNEPRAAGRLQFPLLPLMWTMMMITMIVLRLVILNKFKM
jgi:hypothetical protein